MIRKATLVLAAAVTMLAVALLAVQKKPNQLLLLDWSAKAGEAKAPVAVLVELGLKDKEATVWEGHVSVTGAKVVRREGYRFHAADKLADPDGFKATTRFTGTNRPIPPNARYATVGVVLHLDDLKGDASLTIDAGEDHPKTEVSLKKVLAGETVPLWDGNAMVRRVSEAAPAADGKGEEDFPAGAYGPDGTLWLAYISYTLKDESRRFNHMQIKEQPKDFKAYYTPEFGDQLFVKSYKDGKWSEPLAVTGPKEDLVRCAVAVESGGRVWVAYSANRDGNYDIYARAIEGGPGAPKLAAEQRLTKQPGPDLTPVMCTDQAGNVHLAHQSWDENGSATIRLLTCRDGKWADGPELPGAKAGENRWHAALAAGPDGQVAVAYDVYRDGDYDVHVAVVNGKDVKDYAVAESPLFEARPSLAYDPQGRLWIAYEEGPDQWGKNFGALDTDRGHPLYNVRSVRVACLADGKLQKPEAELPTSKQNQPRAQPNLQTPRYAYPKLGIDGKGRLWLIYRNKQFTPFGVQPGTDWVTMARRLDGDKWTEPLELHRSDGLLDSRPVLLPHAGGSLLVLTNTDGRYATPGTLHNHIYSSVIDLPGEPAEPKLIDLAQAAKKDNAEEAEERATVKQLREYRLESDGKKYQLERGEFHRHTEISFDGGNDGSLEDMWRYAIDVAKLDWISCTDHDNGNGKEYTWWLTQKYTDAYHVGKAFTPIFGYERSVAYPMGHRNCLFVRRGVRTLPRLNEPDKEKSAVPNGNVHVDDTKMFYRYLKELDGICASHTSATNMGTDWRDNDPVVEPIVEIYQGDRNSYEKEEAPRAGYDPKSDKKPANIAGWFPKGYVNLALEKGYRFGFQSSSDHISTHISYCVALAEAPGREGVIAALKKRHCYAATDDILMEVKSGTHLMGDEFKTNAAPKLEIKVVGAKGLKKVEVLKDSEVAATFEPGKREYSGTWTDPKPTKGAHWYYVRVQQEDGALAWASPLYVDFAP
jgi:hypothetical protein